jgi:hypothetical protein
MPIFPALIANSGGNKSNAPTNIILQNNSGASSLSASWTNPAYTSKHPIASYIISLYNSAGTLINENYATVAAPTLTATLTGLSTSTSYYIRVRIRNSANVDSDLSAQSATASTSPTAPTTLTASTTSSSAVNLSWSGATGTITNYGIFWSTTASATPANTSVPQFTSATTTFADTGISQGTSRYYWVRSQGTGGNSIWHPATNGVLGTRRSPPPPPPPPVGSCTDCRTEVRTVSQSTCASSLGVFNVCYNTVTGAQCSSTRTGCI